MVIFVSYKPYLQLCLDRGKRIYITFDENCKYIPQNEYELNALREFVQRYKASCIVAEGESPTELIQANREFENRLIQEAESRALARQEAEIQRNKEHEFYSLLRMTEKAYR